MLELALVLHAAGEKGHTVRNSRTPQLANAFPRCKDCKLLGSIQLNKGIIGGAISDGRVVISPTRFCKDGNTPQVDALNPTASKY